MPLTKEEAVVMTEDADTFTVVRRLLLSEIARRKEQSASFVRSLTDSRGIADLFRCGHEALGSCWCGGAPRDGCAVAAGRE